MPERAAQLYHGLQTAKQVHKAVDVNLDIDSSLGHETKIMYKRPASRHSGGFECLWIFDNVGLVAFFIERGGPDSIDTQLIGTAAGLD